MERGLIFQGFLAFLFIAGPALSACSWGIATNSSNPCNCAVSQTLQDSEIDILNSYTNLTNVAQSFSVSNSIAIAGIQVGLGRAGTSGAASETVQLNLYGNSANNVPNTGQPIATSNVSIQPMNPASTSFCFYSGCTTTINISANTTYWIAISVPNNSTFSTTDYIRVVATATQSLPGQSMYVIWSSNPGVWQGSVSGVTALTNYALNFQLGCQSNANGCSL